MDTTVIAGLALLQVAVFGALASTALAIRRGIYATQDWLLRRSQGKQEVEMIETAIALNGVIDDLIALDVKVNRFRHNIHCPACGRFSRQAFEWPAGTADCKTHGIGLRTSEWTNSIPITVLAVQLEVALTPVPETPSLVLDPPVAIPDYIDELVEHAGS